MGRPRNEKPNMAENRRLKAARRLKSLAQLQEAEKVATQIPAKEGIPGLPLFLTKEQLASALQVSVRCITKMMKRRELPYLKLSYRMVRFRLDAVAQRLTEAALGPCRTGLEGTKSDAGCRIPDAGLGKDKS